MGQLAKVCNALSHFSDSASPPSHTHTHSVALSMIIIYTGFHSFIILAETR